MNAEEMERLIIRVGLLWYSQDIQNKGYRTIHRFSQYTWDAKRYSSVKRARNKAFELGGTVVRFNPANGEIKEEIE